jgi:hypothetical protein
MSDIYYTSAMWRVKPGNEAAFIDAWQALGDVFLTLPNPAGTGYLLQSEADPMLFYSFGSWHSKDDSAAMRADQTAAAALKHLFDLCDEATPGTYRLAAQVG